MTADPLFYEQSITFLYTDDLERHAAFYRDVMGLKLVLEQSVAKIFQWTPTSFLGVCDKEGRPRGNKGIMLTFLVEDAQATYDRLLERGVVFDEPLEARGGYNLRSAFFRDPEGYVLEIQEFMDPRWPYPDGRKPRAIAADPAE
ncbi:VOC family protein [Roseomonas sp. CAU 1739]|uniref:VOC family protein n=1 Tax=Roseomonas sp. CAU 1739 TaxID=3140364 RepID=UPI00325BEE70